MPPEGGIDGSPGSEIGPTVRRQPDPRCVVACAEPCPFDTCIVPFGKLIAEVLAELVTT